MGTAVSPQASPKRRDRTTRLSLLQSCYICCDDDEDLKSELCVGTICGCRTLAVHVHPCLEQLVNHPSQRLRTVSQRLQCDVCHEQYKVGHTVVDRLGGDRPLGRPTGRLLTAGLGLVFPVALVVGVAASVLIVIGTGSVVTILALCIIATASILVVTVRLCALHSLYVRENRRATAIVSAHAARAAAPAGEAADPAGAGPPQDSVQDRGRVNNSDDAEPPRLQIAFDKPGPRALRRNSFRLTLESVVLGSSQRSPPKASTAAGDAAVERTAAARALSVTCRLGWPFAASTVTPVNAQSRQGPAGPPLQADTPSPRARA